MEHLVKGVKEQQFATKEYFLDSRSDAKAVEYAPVYGIKGNGRTIITSLDDLKVSILFHFS
jgi:hypothetical protein